MGLLLENSWVDIAYAICKKDEEEEFKFYSWSQQFFKKILLLVGSWSGNICIQSSLDSLKKPRAKVFNYTNRSRGYTAGIVPEQEQHYSLILGTRCSNRNLLEATSLGNRDKFIMAVLSTHFPTCYLTYGPYQYRTIITL